MAFERELEVALAAAELAGKKIIAEYVNFEVIPNAPANISTQVDHDAQEIILQHLATHFPTDSLCAEEKTASLESARSTGQRIWIVDPIDGTRGFAQKNGEFSVMIGFVQDGQVVVGVVLEPVLNRYTYAVKGEGCKVRVGDTITECRVRNTDVLVNATLTQSRSKHDRGPTGPVRTLQPGHVIETYSAGIKLAQVARGDADLYVIGSGTFRDWDLCAGAILVEEAGGRVSDIRGEPLRFGLSGHIQNRGLIAANALIYPEVLSKFLNRPEPTA